MRMTQAEKAEHLQALLDDFINRNIENHESVGAGVCVTSDHWDTQRLHVEITTSHPVVMHAIATYAEFCRKNEFPRVSLEIRQDDLRVPALNKRLRDMAKEKFGPHVFTRGDIELFAVNTDLTNCIGVKARGTHDQLEIMDAEAERMASELRPPARVIRL